MSLFGTIAGGATGPTGAAGAAGATGAQGVQGPAGPGPLFAYAAASQVISTDTFTTDTHLSVTLASSTKYRITIEIPYTDSSFGSLGGASVRIGGTATYSNFVLEADFYNLGVASGSARWTAPSQDVAVTGVASPSFTASGTVEVNAGGTFFVQSAQVETGSGALTRLRGAVLTYQIIP